MFCSGRSPNSYGRLRARIEALPGMIQPELNIHSAGGSVKCVSIERVIVWKESLTPGGWPARNRLY